MVQITTSTASEELPYAYAAPTCRDNITGYLYTLIQTAVGTLTMYRSTDAGGSWAVWGSSAFTATGVQEVSSLVVDRSGYIHLAYRLNTGTADTINYRRLTLVTGVWSSQLQTSATDANGGVAGATWQGVAIAVVRNPDGTYAIAVAGARTQGTTRYGVQVMGVSITSGGTIYNNSGILVNNREFWTAGTAPGRSGVSIEVEHTGDGFSSNTPHLWISWGRAKLYMVKMAWSGSSVGWTGPSNFITIKSPIPTATYHPGRWDGSRWMMQVISPDDSTKLRIYQRNQANTSTTTYDTPTHPTGAIAHHSLSYDATTGNPRVFATGTSTNVLYYVDYVRATSTWGAWATVIAGAVQGGDEWGVRMGGSSGNAKHDVIYCVAGTPNQVWHVALAAGSVPATPTWDTSAQPYINGGPADVAATLTLDWTFSDPDPGQTQGSYAISRQIGAGALNYWRASDSTWQVAEVQNTSATSALTLASAWALASDAQYTFKAKVWDNTGVPSAAYSAGLVLIPSAKVNPAIVTPTAAQVLSTDQVTMTWTAAEQTSRRVRLLTNPGGVVVLDTGFEVNTDLTYTAPNKLANGSGWTIELTTKNNEGLASTAQTRAFTISYINPPATVSTVTAVPLSGWMQVAGASSAVVGSQPAIVSQDLYRRPKLYAALNANGSMAGNVTGYTGVGTTSMTYSTTQFHDSPGSARAVPTGAAADAQVVLTTPVTIDATKLHIASAWVRPDTANKQIKLVLSWYTAANALISSVSVNIANPVATAWHYIELVGDPTAVATAAKAAMQIGLTGTPAAGDAFYADELKLSQYDAEVGVRVLAGAAANVTYLDWGAWSLTDLEYRWVTVGANGTTISGPWSG